MVNSNSNKGGEFLFPNHDRRRDYSSLIEYRMKIEIPSFSGKLNIESFLDWVNEVEKFFNMTYISKETHVKFVVYKLKGRAAAGETN